MTKTFTSNMFRKNISCIYITINYGKLVIKHYIYLNVEVEVEAEKVEHRSRVTLCVITEGLGAIAKGSP